MNYLIWKEQDSRYIKGLVISELPPISKPQMRVAETVVDGVDGSRIEELGYATYDKSMLIGITPQANIDEVIKYFSGQGDVVFGNEPDKYYKAHIINQIDYARLVRYRTATVTFRVQPFKYEYPEVTTEVAEQEITGTHIQIKDSKITNLSIGNVDAEIKVTGKNLIDPKMATTTVNGVTCTNNGDGSFTLNGTATDNASFRLDQSIYVGNDNLKSYDGEYTLSCNELVNGTSITLMQIETWNSYLTVKASEKVKTADIGKVEDAFVYIYVYADTTLNNLTIRPMLEKGTVATGYEPYKEMRSSVGAISTLPLFEGVNNITNSDDANMVVSYIDNKVYATNLGNHIARPIIEISGTGLIELTVNGNTLFRYTFPDGEDTVVIDSQKQDAYLGVVLKNRNMSGEFPIFEVGVNEITWDGIVKSLKITSKSRWL